MKKVLISIINLYQKMPLLSHSLCRFQPTCSEYAKECIETYGSFKGCFLSFKRIIRCNPFCSCGYDPVPKKEKLNEKN